MSLSGSIEDLPLLEILQVVAFCQKTGSLTVKAPRGEGGVVFREGRVVSGYLWDTPPLGPDLLNAPSDVREREVRRHIEAVLGRLVRLREGQFGFTLAVTAPTRVGERDLSGETLELGVNPEELMLDLARQMDEDRRECTAAIEASFSTAPESEEASLEELPLLEEDVPKATPTLLVDDEPDVSLVLADRLRAGGYAVTTADGVESARDEAARLAAAGEPFLVLTDLGLPDGRSFRGGLEVVRHAATMRPRPGILLMADAIDERLIVRARRLGASTLCYRPSLSKLDPLQYQADLRAFADKLLRDLLPRLERRARSKAPVAAAPATPPLSGPSLASPAEVLAAARAELAAGAEPDEVAFLLMKVARSLLGRAVLFVVKDEELRGLTGFGPAASGSVDLLARELVVPLGPPSPVAEAAASGRPWIGPAPLEGPLAALLGKVGRHAASHVAVLPVQAERETIAVLIGDEPGGAPLPALDPLIGFLEDAGRALESSLLARRARA